MSVKAKETTSPRSSESSKAFLLPIVYPSCAEPYRAFQKLSEDTKNESLFASESHRGAKTGGGGRRWAQDEKGFLTTTPFQNLPELLAHAYHRLECLETLTAQRTHGQAGPRRRDEVHPDMFCAFGDARVRWCANALGNSSRPFIVQASQGDNFHFHHQAK